MVVYLQHQLKTRPMTERAELEKTDTFYNEIKEALKNGENFENEAADWYTINRINKNTSELLIYIKGAWFTYKNLTTYAKRVKKLLNTGC